MNRLTAAILVLLGQRDVRPKRCLICGQYRKWNHRCPKN